MPIFKHRLSCFTTLALLSAMSFTGSNQELQQKPPTSQIRVHTGEVVVDVNVTDRDGKPVPGLTQSDFEVFEDGARQEISSFRSVSRGAPGQVSPPAQDQTKAAQPIDLVPAAPSYPHLISLVIDQVNMEAGAAVRTRKAAQAYVEKILEKDDMAAVFGIGFGIHIYQQFTNDRAGLAKAVQAATSGNTRFPGDVSAEIREALRGIPTGLISSDASDEEKIALAYSISPWEYSDIPALHDLAVLLRFQEFDREGRGSRTLAGLLAIIESQKAVPGRKSMIFFSTGFPLPRADASLMGNATDFRAVSGAANRAGVTIYSVDAAGLRDEDPDADRQTAARGALRSRATVGRNTPLGLMSAAAGLNPLANLEALADDTGGYTVKNTSDLIAGLERIGAYLGEYYVLTYVRSNPINDGKFRSITVKLKRLRFDVRARKGYYALPDTDRLPVFGCEAELLEILNSKSPPAKFPVLAGGYAFPAPNDTSIAALYVQFPLSQLKIEKHSDTKSYLAQADVLLLVKKADGSIVQRMSRQLSLQGSLANLENTQKKDFSFYRRVPLPHGDYTLEAIVRDRSTGNASTCKAQLPATRNDHGNMRVSNVILSRDSVISARNEANENPFNLQDPLQVDGVSVLPDISGTYRKSIDTEIVVYLALEAVQASSQIEATFEFLGEGSNPLRFQKTLPEPDEAGRIRYVTRIALDSFNPGKYELRVSAMDAGGFAAGSVQFRVGR
jgi:VWFA-related protein